MTIAVTPQWAEKFDIGVDTGTPVDDEDYQVPFRSTGALAEPTLTIERPKQRTRSGSWKTAQSSSDTRQRSIEDVFERISQMNVIPHWDETFDIGSDNVHAPIGS